MAIMRASVLAAILAVGCALPLAGCEWLYPSEVASVDGGAGGVGEAGLGTSSGSSGGAASGSGSGGQVGGSSSGIGVGGSSSGVGVSGSSSGGVGSSSGAGGTPDAGATDDAAGGVAPIGFVQVALTDKNFASTVSATYPGPQRAGDFNVLVIGWSTGAHQIASIRDSAGNSYAIGAGISESGIAMDVYFAKGIAASASNTVTVDLNSDDYLSLEILEYSGLSNVDKSAPGGGTGNMASTKATAMTSASRELVFGAGAPDQNASAHFASAGSGFTQRVITPVSGILAEDLVVSQVGSYTASATLDSSSEWAMLVVTFK
jgi:hypothetical protein